MAREHHEGQTFAPETIHGFYNLLAEGKVCIYVEGGDNAIDVNGYSARPGVLGSRYGFKLAWTNSGAGDTFIDAIWVYNYPDKK